MLQTRSLCSTRVDISDTGSFFCHCTVALVHKSLHQPGQPVTKAATY